MKRPLSGVTGSGSFSVLLALVLVTVGGCAIRATQPTVPTSIPFAIGNAVVRAEILQCGLARPTLINVHDDENTSVEAGKAVIRQTGGRLIELAHGGNRRVSFELDGARYSFDPNRIFSEEGIRRTLGRAGNDSAAAQPAVQQFATALIDRFALDQERVIIALHNTGRGGLAINSYRPAGDLNATAAAVHVGQPQRPGDFFYVTDRRFFDYLTARGYNVIWQDDSRVTDDGSLSVYFARRNIPYVNVEAAHGHLEEQTEMVRCAVAMVNKIIFALP